MCFACDKAWLKRGDIVQIEAINWEFYKHQLKLRVGLRGIVVPHNEFFFFKEKGLFEDPEEIAMVKAGQITYDVLMPDGTTLEKVGYTDEKHMVICWAHYTVTNLEPLVKEIEDLSQTKTRALHWTVIGNKTPVWTNRGYIM